MTIQETFDKAIEGDWKSTDDFQSWVLSVGIENLEFQIAIAVLDPKFFQALGKSMGWKEDGDYIPHRMGSHSDTFGGAGDDDYCYCDQPKTYLHYWHALIDHLAEGKDIESYFKEL